MRGEEEGGSEEQKKEKKKKRKKEKRAPGAKGSSLRSLAAHFNEKQMTKHTFHRTQRFLKPGPACL